MGPVRLGTTGLKVSPVCLGMMSLGDSAWRDWVLDEDKAESLIRAAIEAGITFFDIADMYSLGRSEEITGKMTRKYFARREDYVIATKVYMPTGKGPNDRGLSRGHIMDAVDASLRSLGVDHVDLYQIHRYDSETPMEETMEALNDCVRAGKVRYLGASSMFAWQFARAQHTARVNGWTPFVTMQNHYNLLYRVVGAATKTPHGLGVGLLLPYVLTANRPRIDVELAQLAACVGIGGGANDAAEAFIEWIVELNARIGVPSDLQQIGVDRADLRRFAETTTTVTILLQNNPGDNSADGLERVLIAAWQGDREQLR